MTEEAHNSQTTTSEEPVVPEKLGLRSVIWEIFYGAMIAMALGMGWILESVRNFFLRLLDRWNFKPRTRHASAFPPGNSSERTTVQARR